MVRTEILIFGNICVDLSFDQESAFLCNDIITKLDELRIAFTVLDVIFVILSERIVNADSVKPESVFRVSGLVEHLAVCRGKRYGVCVISKIFDLDNRQLIKRVRINRSLYHLTVNILVAVVVVDEPVVYGFTLRVGDFADNDAGVIIRQRDYVKACALEGERRGRPCGISVSVPSGRHVLGNGDLHGAAHGELGGIIVSSIVAVGILLASEFLKSLINVALSCAVSVRLPLRTARRACAACEIHKAVFIIDRRRGDNSYIVRNRIRISSSSTCHSYSESFAFVQNTVERIGDNIIGIYGFSMCRTGNRDYGNRCIGKIRVQICKFDLQRQTKINNIALCVDEYVVQINILSIATFYTITFVVAVSVLCTDFRH